MKARIKSWFQKIKSWNRTFADRSETFRIRLRGKEYRGPGRGPSLLVGGSNDAE